MRAFLWLLAYANAGDNSSDELLWIVGAVGVLVAVTILVVVLMALAHGRRHRRASLISTLAVYWGIILAVSVLYEGSRQMGWSKEYNLQLESGYLDPHNTNGKPEMPWVFWSIFGAVYVGLIGWSVSGKSVSSQTRE
ncbi:MAG TPA: hypothetical protein VGG19_07465 [Tepidisphaeraceae bacterium]|jgi:hypothetical protein